MTIEELLAENKKLKEENNRLKELLRKNNIDYTNENEKKLTTDDKIKIYLSYFKGRNDVYAEKYIKDGKTLNEMRFYDKNGNPIIEIGYHPEPIINNGDRVTNILHYHVYSGLDRINVERMSDHPDVKEKYSIYLKEFDLYD